MAIGTTPLFSKISGSAGPVDYRTRRNGKIEIGKKRIPANPQSTEQQNTRNAYGRLHELWQNAAWIDKTQYENIAAAYNISAWNAFLLRHLPTMRLNPSSYWPFVEGAGNTLHDFTKNENHGTIYGATWQKTGKFNIPRLYFDGLDDYVDCGNNDSLNIAAESCINIKLSPFDTIDSTLVSHLWPLSKSDSGPCGYAASFRGGLGNLVFYSWDCVSGVSTYSTTTEWIGKTWYDLAYTNGGGSRNIMVNGLIEATAAQHTTVLSTSDFLFNLNHGFKGSVGEASIFKKWVTPEINTRLYNLSKRFYEA